MEPEFVTYVGSRSGAAVALIVLGSIPAATGYFVGRACLRAGWGARGASGVGVLLAGGLLGLVYLSLVSGFYELRAHHAHLELRYFLPAMSSQWSWSDIARADARFATKNQWRLQLTDGSGHRVVSAMGRRQDIEAALHEVRRRLATPP